MWYINLYVPRAYIFIMAYNRYMIQTPKEQQLLDDCHDNLKTYIVSMASVHFFWVKEQFPRMSGHRICNVRCSTQSQSSGSKDLSLTESISQNYVTRLCKNTKNW